jgi:hypothetical protein
MSQFIEKEALKASRDQAELNMENQNGVKEQV